MTFKTGKQEPDQGFGKRNLLFVLGFCLLISFLYLLLCTKSSPLYPFNDWVDANAFFTMGKGMMHGLVPYRDLFEQKGPLLYFVYGLASMISYKTFLGGFVLEVVAFTFFLYFSYKSLILFIEKNQALISLPLMAILILDLKAFTHGGSAEELALPLFAVSLYHLLRFFKNNDPHSYSPMVFLINGVIAGCILWVKFSMLGFWLGWILAFFVTLIIMKKTGLAIRGAAIFLGGMLLATLPWILYFGLNHAIGDWINTYFVINLTGYPRNYPGFQRMLMILATLAAQFSLNPVFGTFLWLGIIAFTAFRKFVGSLGRRVLLLLCVILAILGIYGGGPGYIYYYLILAPLSIPGWIVLWDAVMPLIKRPVSSRATYLSISAIVLISVPLLYQFNQNADMHRMKREDLVQYKFAAIINQKENATLLNYGSLDMGFYTTAGILPTTKYFELQNLDYSRYPMNIDEQNRYVREAVTEFVVLRDYATGENAKIDLPVFEKNYQLIASGDQFFEGYKFTYFLYQRVGNGAN